MNQMQPVVSVEKELDEPKKAKQISFPVIFGLSDLCKHLDDTGVE